MDSDEAFHAKTLFHQGSYSTCVSTVQSISSPSLLPLLYSARSLIALHKPSEALALLSSADEPAAQAVKLLASYFTSPTPPADISEQAESLADEIADDEGDGVDAVLRVTVATLLHLSDNTALAVFLLKQGVQVKSLESVALLIYIYLSPALHRPDLARSTYAQAKKWADDAILLQMCEAWIGAVTGVAAVSNGKEPGGYQAAYYVFDEIATLPGGSTSVVALNGKTVAQGAMGHWEEAQGDIGEASQIAGEDHTTIANQFAVSSHLSSTASAAPLREKLRALNPAHPLIANVEFQSAQFDEAASKYAAAKA